MYIILHKFVECIKNKKNINFDLIFYKVSCILDIADEMCVTNKGVPKELECPFFYIWGITGGEKSYIDCRK